MKRDDSRPSTRSASYQYLFTEVTCSPVVWDNYVTSHSMDYYFNPYEYSEEIFALMDRLQSLVFQLAKDVLTEKAFAVFELYWLGYLQKDIALHLGVNQSCVHHAMHGTRNHGGIYRKLRYATAQHPDICALRRQILALREDQLKL